MSNITTGTTDYNMYDFLFLRSNLSGAVLVGVFYGMVLVLYVECMRALWQSWSKLKNANLLMVHSTIIFILNTLYTASVSRVLELTFVDNDNFNGGPLAFLDLTFYIPINVLGTVTFLIANWLLDALMLWRCLVIYTGAYPKSVVVFPTLLLLGSFISGTILLVVTSQPNSSLWSSAAVSSALPYYVLSLSFNVIVTFLIILRLVHHHRTVRTALGSKHAQPYSSLATFMVESAAPYTILSIIYLALFAVNNPIQQVFTGILSGAQIIANYLIILRVAKGNAWDYETSTTAFSVALAEVARDDKKLSPEATGNFALRIIPQTEDEIILDVNCDSDSYNGPAHSQVTIGRV